MRAGRADFRSGPLLWTPRSLRNLVNELAKKGHTVCPTVVGDFEAVAYRVFHASAAEDRCAFK